MSDRPVLAVLDTSAVDAYAGGSVDVGEVMSEVADEGGCVAVPMLCLVQAATDGADIGMLSFLTRNPVIEVFATEPADWQALAAIAGMVADLPAATAALVSTDWQVIVLTRTPELYEGLDGGGDIIAF